MNTHPSIQPKTIGSITAFTLIIIAIAMFTAQWEVVMLIFVIMIICFVAAYLSKNEKIKYSVWIGLSLAILIITALNLVNQLFMLLNLFI